MTNFGFPLFVRYYTSVLLCLAVLGFWSFFILPVTGGVYNQSEATVACTTVNRAVAAGLGSPQHRNSAIVSLVLVGASAVYGYSCILHVHRNCYGICVTPGLKFIF